MLGESLTGQSDNNVAQAAGGNASSQGSFLPVKDSTPAPASPGERMHRGWVRLWRKWRDHEMASDPNATLVFLHLLTEARRDSKLNRRYGYTLQRGQCDLTQDQLAERTALTRKAVREALSRLEKYETIVRGQQKGRQPAIITIVNFDRYNPDATDNGHQEGHGNGQLGATPGEGREVEKLLPSPAKPVRGVIAKPVDPDLVELPDDLKPYQAPITEFLRWRRDDKRKPVRVGVGMSKFLAAVRQCLPDVQAAVDKAIASDWQGLFPVKAQGAQGPSRAFAGSQTDEEIAKYGGR